MHRDVKPANLLVDPGGHVYVTDFGLAKQVLTATGGTRTGQWVGTLDYVAPEQIRAGRVDARADVYALGGVLHFALTGRVPFEREGDEAKLWAQLSAPPPVPSTLRRGLRGEFDTVLARAMAKDPAERYLSAGDLGRAALAAAAGTVPTEPERVVARGAAAPGAAPTEPGLAGEVATRTAATPPLWAPSEPSVGDVSEPTAPAGRRRTPLFAAVGLAALAAVVVAAVLLPGGDDPGSPSARSSPAPTATGTPTPTAVAHYAKTIENVSDRPNGLVLAGGDLWVASARQPRLTRVDAATGRERALHPTVGNEVTAIVAFEDDVWVTVGQTHEVIELDGRSGKLGRHFKVDGKPVRLAVDATGLWVGTQAQGDGPGRLLHYDLAGHLMQTITVNEGIGGLVAGDGAIWVIKARTDKLARLKAGQTVLTDWAALPAPAAAIAYDDGALWVTLDDEDAVARVAADGGNLRTAAAGHSPAQSVVAGGHLFVASRNDNTVVVLDPKTLKPVGEPIDVGFNPYAMAADERSVWVTGLGDNTLTRIDYG